MQEPPREAVKANYKCARPGDSEGLERPRNGDRSAEFGS